MSDYLRPHGLYSPRNFPDQNTGVGSLSLLQGIFPNQKSNPGLLHSSQLLYQLSHQGGPDKAWQVKVTWPRAYGYNVCLKSDTCTLNHHERLLPFCCRNKSIEDSWHQQQQILFLVSGFKSQRASPWLEKSWRLLSKTDIGINIFR